jgi:hypothetical protein
MRRAVTSVHRETDSLATTGLDVPDWQRHRAGRHLDVRLTGEHGPLMTVASGN